MQLGVGGTDSLLLWSCLPFLHSALSFPTVPRACPLTVLSELLLLLDEVAAADDSDARLLAQISEELPHLVLHTESRRRQRAVHVEQQDAVGASAGGVEGHRKGNDLAGGGGGG